MNYKSFILFTLITAYITFCLYLDYNQNYEVTSRIQKNKNDFISMILGENTNSVLLSRSVNDFTDNYIERILNATVIADTTLRGIVFEDDHYFLKADAASNSGSNILLKLKLNKEWMKNLESLDFWNAVLIADISMVRKLPFSREISFFDGGSFWEIQNDDIILEGELIDLALFNADLPAENKI